MPLNACDAEGSCHTLPRQNVLEALGSSEKGLTREEAANRLLEYGANEIREVKGRPMWLKFLENFYHLFAIILWVGAFLAYVGGMPELAWAIVGVIVINGIFSFWQEFKAEKATEALKQLIPRKAKLIRDGDVQEVGASEIVPGDLLLLEEGDNISADARLIEEFELRTNNATLTGESEPVRKTASAHNDDRLGVLEMPNLVFAGTSVAYGGGKAVVFATGMNTQFGRIAELTQGVKEELSPLQKEMERVVRIVAALALGLGLLFFVLGYFVAGLTLVEGFLFAIGIIVANVPEGMLPTLSLALAMGVQRMARRHALIKKLSSVETLGSTTVICTDKTGTLTKNEMTVRDIYVNGQHIQVLGTGYDPSGSFTHEDRPLTPEQNEALEILMRSASLANNARLIPPSTENDSWSILGDPTEAALLVAAQKAGFDYEQELTKQRRIFELPFDSVRKRMTTIHLGKLGRIGYVKGAPQEILTLSTHVATLDGPRPMTAQERDEITAQNDQFARGGLRVLAMAYRDIPESETEYKPDVTERDLVFVGLMAMQDPPREEVATAVEECRTAGIKIIMITGDYGLTAESIARRIGIIRRPDARIITGADLNTMGEGELSEALLGDEVLFARVSPEHKMLIAQALKDLGETVAMTGDGVNDAPALKVADIGVAMGIAGTDVAKEAAEMILTDDNFASIVNAIEEGRAVFDNIRRFVSYIFTSNVPEVIPFILFVIFRIPLPLTVLQILAIDLGTDLLPALALGAEAPEPGIMQRKPRSRKERLLGWKVLRRAYFFLGPIQTAVAMGGFFFAYWVAGWRPGMPMADSGVVYATAITMTLASVVMSQIGNAFAQRTTQESILKIGLFSNRFLIWGILSEIAIILVFIYVPPVAHIFGHAPLGPVHWLYLIAISPTLLIADEIRKYFLRRRQGPAAAPAAARSSAARSGAPIIDGKQAGPVTADERGEGNRA